MKTFFTWTVVVIFLAGLVFFVYRTENKQTYQQATQPLKLTEKLVAGDDTQIAPVQYVELSGAKVKVELATTPEAKALGLGGRSGLAENTGMLFVFYQSDKYAFWMKDMLFPIDIIWIRDDGEVVYVKKNLGPASYPATFRPEENAKYVLEVPAGFSLKNNLKLGDKVKFIY